MTTTCLHTHINDIQCKYADLAYKHAKALAIGKQCKEREQYIKIIDSYLSLLYCYKTFDSDVTYAYNFQITKTGDESVTITISIGTEDFIYTGTGETADINNYFVGLLQADLTYELNAFISENVLYVYSYDTALSFSTATTITSTIDNTVVTTNMEDSYEDIISIWNCVCQNCLCEVIHHAKELTGACNC